MNRKNNLCYCLRSLLFLAFFSQTNCWKLFLLTVFLDQNQTILFFPVLVFTKVKGGAVSKQKASINVCGMTKLRRCWGHRVENRTFAHVYTRSDIKELPGTYVAAGFNRKKD